MSIRYVLCVDNTDYALSLTPRQVYEVIPDPAESHGMIRVIDNTGEDYLFEDYLFQPIENPNELATDLTVSLTWPMKATIYRMANQRGISMNALLREWIDERLDLPVEA